jgi:hypothetical protein
MPPPFELAGQHFWQADIEAVGLALTRGHVTMPRWVTSPYLVGSRNHAAD